MATIAEPIAPPTADTPSGPRAPSPPITTRPARPVIPINALRTRSAGAIISMQPLRIRLDTERVEPDDGDEHLTSIATRATHPPRPDPKLTRSTHHRRPHHP